MVIYFTNTVLGKIKFITDVVIENVKQKYTTIWLISPLLRLVSIVDLKNEKLVVSLQK